MVPLSDASITVRTTSRKPESLLEVEGVVKQFPLGRRGLWDRITRRRQKYVRAVGGATLQVRAGETLVVLGESGSGKTTLGRIIVGLEKPDSGRIVVSGDPVRPVREHGAMRGRLQMVFQDPGSSLDPFMRVRDVVAEPLVKSNLSDEAETEKVLRAIGSVGLDESVLDRQASELSGGQKQRVSVARAMISNPEVIVLDEPTSSIDVSIQAQVLNLLVELQKQNDYAYVLITHDPNVARFMADGIAVMYLGKIVESGPAAQVLQQPKHPYTHALLSSAPRLGETSIPEVIKGEPPSLINLPPGCPYAPRCPHTMEVCREREPQPYQVEGASVACYLYDNDVVSRAESAG
jgi:peptide/nickel transport system ATP-binding protein